MLIRIRWLNLMFSKYHLPIEIKIIECYIFIRKKYQEHWHNWLYPNILAEVLVLHRRTSNSRNFSYSKKNLCSAYTNLQLHSKKNFKKQFQQTNYHRIWIHFFTTSGQKECNFEIYKPKITIIINQLWNSTIIEVKLQFLLICEE